MNARESVLKGWKRGPEAWLLASIPCALLVFVGSFLPWAIVPEGLYSVQRLGTDGAGVATAPLGLLAGLSAFLALTLRRRLLSNLAAAGLLAAACVVALVNLVSNYQAPTRIEAGLVLVAVGTTIGLALSLVALAYPEHHRRDSRS